MNLYKNTQWIRVRWQAALLPLALASMAAAQPVEVPFVMTYTQGPITTTLANDSVLTLAAPLGQSQTVRIRAEYTGAGSVTISQPPSLTGSSAFGVTINGSVPVTITRGEAFFFSVSFSPVTAAVDSARTAIPFQETPTTTIQPITLSLQGVTAAIVPSYTTPDDNNVVQLTPGATIPFPDTPVGQSIPISLNFTNIGSLVGQVTKVTSTGGSFILQNLPLFPATVAAGQTITMRILFRPTATGPAAGTLTLETAGADPINIQLLGNGTAAKLSYQSGTPSTAILPGGTLTLPSAEITQTSSTVFRVTNTGTAPTTVSSISTAGGGFQTINVPQLPKTLAPNESLIFGVTFTPTRSGVQTSALAVNSDVFNLSGSGLGPQLSYSYVAGGSTITLGGGNNTIIFSPVRITESAQIGLDIKNVGTTPATIQNIGVGQNGSAFSITNPQVLPVGIAPNATLRVNLKFEPTVVGFASTTLIVDNYTITLTGSGTTPPALPAYSIVGVSGALLPLTQPNVGVKLASPYPVALTGTLTLSPAAGNLPADPAVQFATGGRTVNFRIPANSTDAIFGALGTQLGLQTGTVAGTVTLTPTFATQAGNVDLTPATPITAQFSVSPAAPTILTLQVLDATSSGFTVQINGFSTTRTLTALNFQLTVAPGFEMAKTQFAIDMKAIAATWFQSAASQAFGGQFRITVPFNFQLPAGQSVRTGITAVSVTMTNESGTSVAVQTQVQ